MAKKIRLDVTKKRLHSLAEGINGKGRVVKCPVCGRRAIEGEYAPKLDTKGDLPCRVKIRREFFHAGSVQVQLGMFASWTDLDTCGDSIAAPADVEDLYIRGRRIGRAKAVVRAQAHALDFEILVLGEKEREEILAAVRALEDFGKADELHAKARVYEGLRCLRSMGLETLVEESLRDLKAEAELVEREA